MKHVLKIAAAAAAAAAALALSAGTANAADKVVLQLK
jgi:hypothetical protein